MRYEVSGRCFRFLPPLPALVFLGVSFLYAPADLSGQVVQGHLYDIKTGRPVANGTVALHDSVGVVVAQTGTDEEGAFRLTARSPGLYSLLAVGMGYRFTPADSIELREDEVTVVDIFLPPRPLEMEPILVEARRRRTVAVLEKQGFYRRQRLGFGYFLNPEQIERWGYMSVVDLLARAPFVHADWTVEGPTVRVGSRRVERGSCMPAVYVDGARMMWGSPELWVNAEDVVGVEVFRGWTQIPPEWMGFGACAVILIWTNLGGV